MSEFEIVSLFHQVVAGSNASMTNFLTVLLAMLVASYLAAEKLDRKATWVVLGVYSVFSFGMINELYAGYRDFAAIGMEMVRVGQQPGSSIGWHPTVANGGAGLNMIPGMVLAIVLVAYLSSIWFFFHMRQKRRLPPPSENLAVGEAA